MPLCRSGRNLSLPCESEFAYGDLVANSIETGVELFHDVLDFCEQGKINLRLGKVLHNSQLYVTLQHPDIFLRSSSVERPLKPLRKDSFPKSFPGKIALKKAYPIPEEVGEIRHFTGDHITESLLHEIKDSLGPQLENFDHFLSLQAVNSELVTISTRRAETGGDIDSCLIGYFEDDRYDIIAWLGNTDDCGLVNASFLHFYRQSTGESFSFYHPLESEFGSEQPISRFTLFPRKTSSLAKIASYKLFSKIPRIQ